MNIIIDTNFIFSYTSSEDSNHQKARKLLLSIKDSDKVIIPVNVIAELYCGTDDVENINKFCYRLADKIEPILEIDLKFIEKIKFSERRKLKANDCIILSICGRYNAELLTFDKKLLKAYSEISKI